MMAITIKDCYILFMVLLLLLSYIKYQLFDYPQMSARHKIFGINTLREKIKNLKLFFLALVMV